MQFDDEVVVVAAAPGVRDLDRAAAARITETGDEQQRLAERDVEQFGLLYVGIDGAQVLQEIASFPLFDAGIRRANAEAAKVRYDAATTIYAARLRTAISLILCSPEFLRR